VIVSFVLADTATASLPSGLPRKSVSLSATTFWSRPAPSPAA